MVNLFNNILELLTIFLNVSLIIGYSMVQSHNMILVGRDNSRQDKNKCSIELIALLTETRNLVDRIRNVLMGQKRG